MKLKNIFFALLFFCGLNCLAKGSIEEIQETPLLKIARHLEWIRQQNNERLWDLVDEVLWLDILRSQSYFSDHNVEFAFALMDLENFLSNCPESFVNIDYRRNELTPLMEATRAGVFQLVKLLIEFHADVNARGPNRDPVVLYAARKKREDVLSLLMKNGAEPSVENAMGMSAYKFLFKDRFNTRHLSLIIEEAMIERTEGLLRLAWQRRAEITGRMLRRDREL